MNYTESGGADMEIQELRELQKSALKDEGIQAFEKHIGRIEWLHPKGEAYLIIKSKYKYAIVDMTTKKIAYQADRMEDIAKEYCTTISKVSKSYTEQSLLRRKYMVVRCINE